MGHFCCPRKHGEQRGASRDGTRHGGGYFRSLPLELSRAVHALVAAIGRPGRSCRRDYHRNAARRQHAFDRQMCILGPKTRLVKDYRRPKVR